MDIAPEYCVITTTFSDAAVGERLIDALMSCKLAACIQALQIASYYHWDGKLNNEKETLLLIKTKTALYPEVEACIRANHSYDLPEIIMLPITGGSPEYLAWISRECG